MAAVQPEPWFRALITTTTTTTTPNNNNNHRVATTQYQIRCTVRGYNSSRTVCLGTLYGHEWIYWQSKFKTTSFWAVVGI
jgi:hypothetical protein